VTKEDVEFLEVDVLEVHDLDDVSVKTDETLNITPEVLPIIFIKFPP
jgi:hypothetical protein